MYCAIWSDETYLCGVVDLERGLALRVEVAVILELVKFTNNDLPNKSVSSTADIDHHARAKPTSWLDPGNFTVASCVSLYRLNAGRREGMISSPSEVKACTSNQVVGISIAIRVGVGVTGIWKGSVTLRGPFTGDDIGELIKHKSAIIP
jgi:hypothetical protein